MITNNPMYFCKINRSEVVSKRYISFKGSRAPPKFWNDISNHKYYFDELAKALQITKYEDWYNVKTSDIEERGGRTLLNSYYESSMFKALKATYPSYDWKPWLFSQTPKGYWDNIKNQKEFFDWLARDKKFKSMEDWYSVTKSDIERSGGAGLLRTQYNSSHIKALMSVYPEYDWKIWRFGQLPRNYWDNEQHVKSFLEWASKELSINKMEDWYYIEREQIDKLAGITLLQKYGNLHQLLSKFYPSHNWNLATIASPSKAQGYLVNIIKDVFPHTQIETDYRHPKLNFLSTERDMELDIFLPDLNIAFEYQGQQHYKVHYLLGSPEKQQKRDAEKRELCQKIGLTLIEVPYWWDRRKGSLVASIAEKRPDLFPNWKGDTKPI